MLPSKNVFVYCSMKSSSPSLEGVQLVNWVFWWRRVISLRFKTFGLPCGQPIIPPCILVPSENHNIPLTSKPPQRGHKRHGPCGGGARGCLWSTEVSCSHVHTKPTWPQDFRLWVNKTIAKTFPYSVHMAIETAHFCRDNLPCEYARWNSPLPFQRVPRMKAGSSGGGG